MLNLIILLTSLQSEAFYGVHQNLDALAASAADTKDLLLQDSIYYYSTGILVVDSDKTLRGVDGTFITPVFSGSSMTLFTLKNSSLVLSTLLLERSNFEVLYASVDGNSKVDILNCVIQLGGTICPPFSLDGGLLSFSNLTLKPSVYSRCPSIFECTENGGEAILAHSIFDSADIYGSNAFFSHTLASRVDVRNCQFSNFTQFNKVVERAMSHEALICTVSSSYFTVCQTPLYGTVVIGMLAPSFSSMNSTYSSIDNTVYHEPQVHHSDTSYSSDEFLECYSNSSGGAIQMLGGGTLSTQSCKFQKCTTSDSGGAIYCKSAETTRVTLQSAKIVDCNASNYGGGVYVYGAITLQKTEIEDCYAHSAGGLYIDNEKATYSVTIQSSDIINCHATERSGGGLIVDRLYSSMTIQSSMFSKCKSFSSGGAIYFGSAMESGKTVSLTMQATKFRSNNVESSTATGNDIFSEAPWEQTFRRATFQLCTSTSSSPRVYVTGWGQKDDLLTDEGMAGWLIAVIVVAAVLVVVVPILICICCCCCGCCIALRGKNSSSQYVSAPHSTGMVVASVGMQQPSLYNQPSYGAPPQGGYSAPGYPAQQPMYSPQQAYPVQPMAYPATTYGFQPGYTATSKDSGDGTQQATIPSEVAVGVKL